MSHLVFLFVFFIDLATYLLAAGARTDIKATGRFFNPNNGTVNYGEYPMSFAVCTEQPEMLEILWMHGTKHRKKNIL